MRPLLAIRKKILGIAQNPQSKKFFKVALLCFLCIYVLSYVGAIRLRSLYESQISAIYLDRNGEEITILANNKGLFMRPAKVIPPELKALVVAKEDNFFYYHLGINPFSIVRSLFKFPFTGRIEGSSTLTQQLTKNLLGNESNRSLANKLFESLLAVALEIHSSKDDILSMYLGTAYFGNQAEGIEEASREYFNTEPAALSTAQNLKLLSTLSNPNYYPGTKVNEKKTNFFSKLLALPIQQNSVDDRSILEGDAPYNRQTPQLFELQSFDFNCKAPCRLSTDKNLTEKLREMLRDNLASPAFSGISNGAIVVLGTSKDSNENQLLAIVGSPDPSATKNGYQINMALSPRPIGSTAKPFIYARAFAEGARPYTLINDIEYKYDIGTGFAFYPKNYDGKYHGTVTLHGALSNSLNVPAVKVLQYVGLQNFYDFLTDQFHFQPLQPFEKYELSIALGGLETNLLALSNYFTIFPNEGVLKNVRLSENDLAKIPMVANYETHNVIDSAYTELVTKILSDRLTGVDQFGLKSNLNLAAKNYAVKTGTSYDYHDSWTIGYTPDFLVGVWLGNSDNTAMEHISGQMGAGKIWHDAMEMMLNSPYNKQTDFHFEKIKEYAIYNNIEYGLPGDDLKAIQLLLKNNSLILSPHSNDTFRYENGMVIPFAAQEQVSWYIDDALVAYGREYSWMPKAPGRYVVSAKNAKGESEKHTLIINAN